MGVEPILQWHHNNVIRSPLWLVELVQKINFER